MLIRRGGLTPRTQKICHHGIAHGLIGRTAQAEQVGRMVGRGDADAIRTGEPAAPFLADVKVRVNQNRSRNRAKAEDHPRMDDPDLLEKQVAKRLHLFRAWGAVDEAAVPPGHWTDLYRIGNPEAMPGDAGQIEEAIQNAAGRPLEWSAGRDLFLSRCLTDQCQWCIHVALTQYLGTALTCLSFNGLQCFPFNHRSRCHRLSSLDPLGSPTGRTAEPAPGMPRGQR